MICPACGHTTTRKEMTRAEKRVYIAIVEFRARYARSPTLRELCDFLGFTSQGNMSEHIKRIVAKGWLEHGHNRQADYRPVED